MLEMNIYNCLLPSQTVIDDQLLIALLKINSSQLGPQFGLGCGMKREELNHFHPELSCQSKPTSSQTTTSPGKGGGGEKQTAKN